MEFYSKSDSFTAASSGTTVTARNPVDSYSLSVAEVGGVATSWTVVLEGSNDGTNFATLISHSRTDGNGVPKFPADAISRPVLFLRTRCTAVVLGTATSIKATFVGN